MISIEQYAKLKLLPKERKFCYDQVQLILEEDIEKYVKILAIRQTNIIDNYMLFLLKKEMLSRDLGRVNKGIWSQIDSNNAMSIRSEYYASNPYRKYRR